MVSFKEQKEQFVSGLQGGTIDEVAALLAMSVASYFVWTSVSKAGFQSVFADFAVNCLLVLASVTVYSGRLNQLYALVLIPAVICLVYVVATSKSVKQPPKSTKAVPELLPRKSFITNYRSNMLIMTNIAILAVDFHIFPRRFGKVESWGTSLMDLGVGAFVFSMGIVSTRSLIKNQGVSHGYFKVLSKAATKSLPLLVLGFARFISVKSLEYQEHVTEYGVHWNFFLTLGFLPVVLALLDPILNVLPRLLVAFAISVGYEYLLETTDLRKFIFDPSNRMDNLVTMNKEGIWSFWGYFAIFLFGQSFGQFVMPGVPTKNNLLFVSNKPSRQGWFSVSTTKGLAIASVVYGGIFYYVYHSRYFASISRRLANFPYVMWIVSFSAFVLLGYSVLYDLGAVATSPIIEATNNNGLFAFLLGNVSTGLINMSINTLSCSDPQAFAVLVAYLGMISLVLVQLDKRKIYLRL